MTRHRITVHEINKITYKNVTYEIPDGLKIRNKKSAAGLVEVSEDRWVQFSLAADRGIIRRVRK